MSVKACYLTRQLLLLSIFVLSVKCYFFYGNDLSFDSSDSLGNELRDLESTTSYFETEAKAWTLTSCLTSSNASQCGGTWLLGGFGIVGDGGTFTRTYTSLPSHDTIYFSMDIYIIDLLEITDIFKMAFDSTIIQTWSSSFGAAFTSTPNTQICGGSRTDYYSINVRGQAAHNSSSLTVKLYSLATTANNYFSVGFRNLNLLFQVGSMSTTSVCALSDFLGTPSSCLCSKGQYDSSGLLGCTSCNNNCETCDGPSAQNCTSCAAGYSYNGNTCFQCHSSCYQCNGTAATNCIRCSTGKFLYWNGTCQSSCPSPLVTTTVGEDKYCNLPCGSNYLYENSTWCGSSCVTPAPFVLSTSSLSTDLKYCNFTCSDPSQYLYWNNSCYTGCAFPLVNVTQGVERYCKLPCSGTQVYYLNNNTCQASCQYPYVQNSTGGFNYCVFMCNSSQYLYWNGTCQSTCPSPLVNSTVGGNLYCDLPCSGSQVYYLKNNTCQASCQYPYVEKSSEDFRYCEFKCSSSEYLYWNGTCLPTCPTSYRVISGTEMYCNKYCPTNQFLFPNSTCVSYCDSPLVQTVDAESYKTCSLPCTSGQYLLPDNSCNNTCDYVQSSDQDGVSLCNYPCSQDAFLYENNTCLTNCTTPYVTEIINSNLTFCNSPCSSGQIYLPSEARCVTQCGSPLVALQSGTLKYCGAATDNSIPYSSGGIETLAQVMKSVGDVLRKNTPYSGFIYALVKLIKYVRYMNVPIQEDIRQILNANASTSPISLTRIFSYPIPENLKVQFTERRLTEIYDEQSNHSSYIVNHWENLLVYVILLALGLIFTNLEKIVNKFSNRKTVILVIKRLRIITRWNFLMFVLFNTYDDLTLFAAFEFKRGLHSDSFPLIFSFLTCIFMTCVALYMLGKVLYISKQAIKYKNQLAGVNSLSPEIMFYKKWEDYQVVYAGFNNTSLLSQAFLFFFTCRIIITYLFVAFLQAYPVVQSLIFALLSALMLGYLLKVKPMRHRFCFTANLIFEILVMIVNLCLVLLSAANATDSLSYKSQYGLSVTILMMNLLIEILGNAFAWTYFILAMWEAYKAGKLYGTSGKTTWLNVIVAPFKNPGQAFSELSKPEILKSEEFETFEDQKQVKAVKSSWANKVTTSLAEKFKMKKPIGRVVPLNDSTQRRDSTDTEIRDKSGLQDKSDLTERQKFVSASRIPLAQEQKTAVDIEEDLPSNTPRLRIERPSPVTPLQLPEPLSLLTAKKEPTSPLSCSSSTLNTRRKSSFVPSSLLSQQPKKAELVENLTIDNVHARKSSFNPHSHELLGLRAPRNISDTLSISPYSPDTEKTNLIIDTAEGVTPQNRSQRKHSSKELESQNLEIYLNPESSPSTWLRRKSVSHRRSMIRGVDTNSIELKHDDNTPISSRSLLKEIGSNVRLVPSAQTSQVMIDSESLAQQGTLNLNGSFSFANEEERRKNRKSMIGDLFFQPARMLKTKIWAVNKMTDMRRKSLAAVPMPKNLGEAWRES